MARSFVWRREAYAHNTQDDNTSFRGAVQMRGINPGETLTRVHLMWFAGNVYSDTLIPPEDYYRPMYMGLIMLPGGISPAFPSPLSTPDADWLWLGQVEWNMSIAPGTNKPDANGCGGVADVEAQRKNDLTELLFLNFRWGLPIADPPTELAVRLTWYLYVSMGVLLAPGA